MSLINLKDLLNNAKQNKYAVGAFNITNLASIDYIVDAAKEQQSPIVLQVAEVHLKYFSLEDIAPAIISAAKKVDIPICVHLDHGLTFTTVIRAIRAGFTSVMYDGSTHPIDENIEITREIVKIAKSVGVSVEGEIGHIGGESVGEKTREGGVANKESFTKVEEAVRFYNETGVDALAIAIGSVHGFYKGKPELDFDRLVQIRDAVPVPLVLHGGSGISDDDFKKSISLGICKINFYTQASVAAMDEIKKYLKEYPDANSFPDLISRGMEGFKATVKDMLEVFGSKGMCAPEKTLCFSCADRTCGFADPRLKPSAKTISYSDLIEEISQKVVSNIKHGDL
jgi:fructose-bisphosphate aldolase, class II